MSTGMMLETAGEVLDVARVTRVDMPVMRVHMQVPDATGDLARLCWVQLPELARRMGAPIAEDEGYPADVAVGDRRLLHAIGESVGRSREFSSWYPQHLLSPATRSLFARGEDNALDEMMTRFARDRGFERDDPLARESTPSPAHGRIAAFQAMSQGASLAR